MVLMRRVAVALLLAVAGACTKPRYMATVTSGAESDVAALEAHAVRWGGVANIVSRTSPSGRLDVLASPAESSALALSCADASRGIVFGEVAVAPGDTCDVPDPGANDTFTVHAEVRGRYRTTWVRIASRKWDAAVIECDGDNVLSVTVYADSLVSGCFSPLLDERLGVAWRESVATFVPDSGAELKPGLFAAFAPAGMSLYVVPGPGIHGLVPVLRFVQVAGAGAGP